MRSDGIRPPSLSNFLKGCDKLSNWRITIQWDFISPSLQIASGMIFIEKMTSNLKFIIHPEKQFKFKVKVETGRVGYRALEDGHRFPHEWDKVKDLVDTMVSSYFAGLTLKNSIYHWVDENVDFTDPQDVHLAEDERVIS